MVRLRVTSDRHPRWKNDAPPQRTTGDASASSIHGHGSAADRVTDGIAGHDVGHRQEEERHVTASETMKRRRMSASSPSSCGSAVATRGSSAMPQTGTCPGRAARSAGASTCARRRRRPPARAASAERKPAVRRRARSARDRPRTSRGIARCRNEAAARRGRCGASRSTARRPSRRPGPPRARRRGRTGSDAGGRARGGGCPCLERC